MFDPLISIRVLLFLSLCLGTQHSGPHRKAFWMKKKRKKKKRKGPNKKNAQVFVFKKKRTRRGHQRRRRAEGVRPVTRSVSHGRLRPAGRDHFLLWLVIARELRGHCTCPNSKKNGYKKTLSFFLFFFTKKGPNHLQKRRRCWRRLLPSLLSFASVDAARLCREREHAPASALASTKK